MSENVVVGFKNVHDYPISIGVKFGGRPFKCTLWRDEMFKSREGVPLIPDKEEWPRLLRLGIKPVYSNVEATKDGHPSQPRTEIILDDSALMDAKDKAEQEKVKVAEFEDVIPPIDETADAPKPVGHLERKDNPNSANSAMAWQDGDGVWIFNRDGKQNLNPAKIKAHIKKTYGEEYLEQVEWVSFGVKPTSAAV